MEDVKGYMLIVVGALMAAEMLAVILPSGNYKPFVRLAIGIMLMTALIYPVINCSGTGEEIVFETNTTEKVQEGSYSQMIMAAYEAMERDG